jgi:hypothetical protein
MPKDYDYRHPEIDRDCQKQKAIARYQCLISIKKSDLSFEEQLFLENFAAAMHYLWGFPSASISAPNTIPFPIRHNQAS